MITHLASTYPDISFWGLMDIYRMLYLLKHVIMVKNYHKFFKLPSALEKLLLLPAQAQTKSLAFYLNVYNDTLK